MGWVRQGAGQRRAWQVGVSAINTHLQGNKKKDLVATVWFPAATPSCFSQETLCEGVSEARLIPGRSGPGRLPSGSIRP